MKTAFVEFTPRHLEKALDVARGIATFGSIEFTADGILRMRVMDPAKVIYMDFYLAPETYKCDEEFSFGVHLGMFYKLIRSLNNDHSVEIEVDENIMKINQLEHYHQLVSQEIPMKVPVLVYTPGPSVKVSTKTFQKYTRALANIAPAVEFNYVPHANTLFMEAVNSMYRTLYSIDTSETLNNEEGEEYRKRFMIKFVETAINPGLGDDITLYFGDSLRIHYTQPNLQADLTISAYTEG